MEVIAVDFVKFFLLFIMNDFLKLINVDINSMSGSEHKFVYSSVSDLEVNDFNNNIFLLDKNEDETIQKVMYYFLRELDVQTSQRFKLLKRRLIEQVKISYYIYICNLRTVEYLLNEPSIITIPKICHYIFEPLKYTELPESWKNNYEQCKDHNPDYSFKIWNLKDVENLISHKYKEYLPLFLNLPYKISQIDYARFFILHHEGGIYLDFDNVVNGSLDLLIRNVDALFVHGINNLVNNSTMATIPNNKLFENFMKNTAEFTKKIENSLTFQEEVLNISGPGMISTVLSSDILSKCHEDYRNLSKFIPTDINRVRFLPIYYTQCSSNLTNSNLRNPLNKLLFYHTYDCSWV